MISNTTRKQNSFIFDCRNCTTPCDGNSKMDYRFTKDVEFSEHFENRIIAALNKRENVFARKSPENMFPDIEVFKDGNKKADYYLEIKVQRRTFMSIKRILPNCNLAPSETIALNLSDLLRYFKIEESNNLKIYLVWVLLNRPCVLRNDSYHIYYQNITELKQIYAKELEKRRFRRKTGEGDIVNGQHKGVTVNYHFSLHELERLNIRI